MIECRKAAGLLLDYIEGSLNPDLRDRLRKHFEDCPPCLRFIESYKRTATLCKETLMKEAPAEMGDRLTAFLRQQCKGSDGSDCS